MSKKIDLNNKKFGDWVVLSFIGGKDHKWLCRCKCNTIQEVAGALLRHGKSHRCFNCFIKEEKLIDIQNEQFNNWTVLEYRKNSYWLCRCSCGVEREVESWSLQTGHSKSCGCLKPKFDIYNYLYRKAKDGAIKRNIIFSVTKEYLRELLEQQNFKCAISKLDLQLGILTQHSKNSAKVWDKENTASIDRIDSNKGYEIGNVQWVHKDINLMKLDLSQSKFIEYCKIVFNNN